MKKQRKEIQNQRYELYDKERLTNIERCKTKRNEIIAHSKKVIPKKYEEEREKKTKNTKNIVTNKNITKNKIKVKMFNKKENNKNPKKNL